VPMNAHMYASVSVNVGCIAIARSAFKFLVDCKPIGGTRAARHDTYLSATDGMRYRRAGQPKPARDGSTANSTRLWRICPVDHSSG